MNSRHLLRFLTLCIFFHISWSVEKNCKKEKRCKTTHTLGLKASDCYRMDLKEIPKCLPYNIDVIELSYNRIRKVGKADLANYPYIKHLYLMDNLIVNLDEESFKDLTSLETLDLSMNAIRKIPPAIFQLPSLKTLYLSQNLNINIAESVEEAKPIASPLTKLDISYVTDEDGMTEFPDFGEMPLLAALNITGDQFSYLSTRHFAGLCNLQILVSSNVTAEYESNCDCWRINNWLKDRKVRFSMFLCPVNKEECLDLEVNQEDLDLYENCREKFKQIERTAVLSKVGLGVGIGAGIILLVALIFLYRIWKRSRTKREALRAKKTALKQPDSLLLLSQTKV